MDGGAKGRVVVGRAGRAVLTGGFAALMLVGSAAGRAGAAANRKVGFIGCLTKSGEGELGTQVSEALEKNLDRDRVPGFEFLYGAVARGRASLKGGPVNPKRIAAAGRAIGADEVIVCLLTYKRTRAAVIPGTTKTETVTRNETDYTDEVYYTDVPNPDYEEPVTATIPVGQFGPVRLSVNVGGTKVPKTIREKHVRRVPRTRTVSEEVTEPDAPPSEKSGSVRLRAAYAIVDAVSGATKARDTVSYVDEIEPMWDSIESDRDLRDKAADSAVDALEKSILEKLPSTARLR